MANSLDTLISDDTEWKRTSKMDPNYPTKAEQSFYKLLENIQPILVSVKNKLLKMMTVVFLEYHQSRLWLYAANVIVLTPIVIIHYFLATWFGIRMMK
jgi:hypothetical protein